MLKYATLVALSCGLFLTAHSASGQSVIANDPSPDKDFPPSLAGITVPSHGVDMDATLYLASGRGPHGTVLLLHGLPGYESNADLAQSIRRAGWNVLIFHYRGLWGVGGSFSSSAAIEDTAAAIHFLRDPANAPAYRGDPRRLVLIGHSMGGFLAGYEASRDSSITAVAMIAAVNLGRINFNPADRDLRMRRWESQHHPVHGESVAEIFGEAEQHASDWDYIRWADSLKTRPVLLVEADDQNRQDMEALALALHQRSAAALQVEKLATDHSFSDHRIALQTIVVHWLESLK